jgi:hypothetical protein
MTAGESAAGRRFLAILDQNPADVAFRLVLEWMLIDSNSLSCSHWSGNPLLLRKSTVLDRKN